MEIAIFISEFFGDLSNLAPSVLMIIVATLIVFLISRRKHISSPLAVALGATVLSGAVLFCGLIVVGDISLGVATNVLSDPLFFVGFGLSIFIACPPVWLAARVLAKRQKLIFLRQTDAFE